MVRVKTFLGCIQLETGGLCLGWFFFTTFFVTTGLIFVFGLKSIIGSPHPLYTLVWLDIIIFLIIVVYSSWLMIQGIKTKNPSKIQPFRMIFIAAIILSTLGLIIFSYKIYSDSSKPEVVSEKFDREILNIIEEYFTIIRIVVNVLFLFMSIYIFIFVDSLHKSVKEYRNRLYAIAKM